MTPTITNNTRATVYEIAFANMFKMVLIWLPGE